MACVELVDVDTRMAEAAGVGPALLQDANRSRRFSSASFRSGRTFKATVRWSFSSSGGRRLPCRLRRSVSE